MNNLVHQKNNFFIQKIDQFIIDLPSLIDMNVEEVWLFGSVVHQFFNPPISISEPNDIDIALIVSSGKTISDYISTLKKVYSSSEINYAMCYTGGKKNNCDGSINFHFTIADEKCNNSAIINSIKSGICLWQREAA